MDLSSEDNIDKTEEKLHEIEFVTVKEEGAEGENLDEVKNVVIKEEFILPDEIEQPESYPAVEVIKQETINIKEEENVEDDENLEDNIQKNFYHLLQETHSKVDEFQTDLNSKHFNFTTEFWDSIVRSGKTYKCHSCSLTFISIMARRKHESETDCGITYKCNICEEIYPAQKLLINHMKKHDAARGYQCDTCRKVVPDENDFKDHLKAHKNKKGFRCVLCNRKFKTPDDLIWHYGSQHVEKKSKKAKKKKPSKKRIEIAKYINADREPPPVTTVIETTTNIMDPMRPNHQCIECGKCFHAQYDFLCHLKLHHEFLKCTTCQRQFENPADFLKHSFTHPFEPNSVVSVKVPNRCVIKNKSSEDSVLFKCEKCNETFGDKKSLVQHGKIHSDLHTCSECNKYFTYESNLERHMESHKFKKNILSNFKKLLSNP